MEPQDEFLKNAEDHGVRVPTAHERYRRPRVLLDLERVDHSIVHVACVRARGAVVQARDRP
jgi:hypothetical protein